MPFLPRGVWRRPDFLKLWAGQATSMFGSLIGGLAYDLVAIITLHATAWQIAVLNGCALVPGMIAGPWTGVLADRMRHRPLLIAADLSRALMLASIPAAALLHGLTMLQIDAVAAVVSVLTILFDVSFRSYVPVLLGRGQLIEGNIALQGTAAVAEAGGFAAAGLLVQLFTAPIAVAFDAVSFLLSALAISSIRTPERRARVEQPEESRGSWQDIVEGVRTVWRHPILRALTLMACAEEIGMQPIGVVIMLFFFHDLHLTPGEMGPLFGIGGVSAFFGALLCRRVLARWGVGPAVIGGMYVNTIGLVAVIVAGGPAPLVLCLLGLGQATDGGRTIAEIGVTSLLQSHAPKGVMGRVFATYETLRSIAHLLGLAIGGVLGQTLGLRPVLILGLAAGLVVPLCLLLSPVRCVRTVEAEPIPEMVAV